MDGFSETKRDMFKGSVFFPADKNSLEMNKSAK